MTKKAKAIKLEDEIIDIKNPNYEFISTNSKLLESLKEIKKEDIIAIDSEADGLDPYSANIIFLQVATPKKAYIYNFKNIDSSLFKDILEDPKKLKLMQNGKFDYSMIKAKMNIEVTNIFDTMLAERILTTGVTRENSLGAISKKYLNIELDKDWESFDWKKAGITGSYTKRHFNYAALDTLVLFPIFKKQFRELKKENLTKIARLEFECVPVVAEMELKGSLIDVKKWKENTDVLIKRRDSIAGKIQDEIRPLYKNQQTDLFGNKTDVVNLNSQPQLMNLLNDKLGLDVPSTGEAILKTIDHPICKMLLEYRGLEKLISAFGENLLSKIHPITGRLHPDYMQIGADTGRFACSNPNLQQIPQDSAFRECFIAKKGYKLVTSDYSQMELRILAEASGDESFIKAFKQGKDFHSLTASQMMGLSFDKISKKQRTIAKTINFGLMYGRGANSIAVQLGIPQEEAKKFLKAYFKRYPKVNRWLEKTAKKAIKDGFSETLAGRKRWYVMPDQSDPNYERSLGYIERQAKNHPIQGTNADITKYGLILTYKKIKELGFDASIIHTVHDEIVSEVAEDQAEEFSNVQKTEMEKAGKMILKKVPVSVDSSVSDVWEH